MRILMLIVVLFAACNSSPTIIEEVEIVDSVEIVEAVEELEIIEIKEADILEEVVEVEVKDIANPDWILYENELIGITFLYPPEWGELSVYESEGYNTENNKEFITGFYSGEYGYTELELLEADDVYKVTINFKNGPFLATINSDAQELYGRGGMLSDDAMKYADTGANMLTCISLENCSFWATKNGIGIHEIFVEVIYSFEDILGENIYIFGFGKIGDASFDGFHVQTESEPDLDLYHEWLETIEFF
jgi:hypothetical protein